MVVGHAGGIDGFNSLLIFDTATNITIAMFQNYYDNS